MERRTESGAQRHPAAAPAHRRPAAGFRCYGDHRQQHRSSVEDTRLSAQVNCPSHTKNNPKTPPRHQLHHLFNPRGVFLYRKKDVKCVSCPVLSPPHRVLTSEITGQGSRLGAGPAFTAPGVNTSQGNTLTFHLQGGGRKERGSTALLPTLSLGLYTLTRPVTSLLLR